MEVVFERCTKEVDLGGKQELGRLGTGWRMGVEWILGLVFHKGVWALENWQEQAETNVIECLTYSRSQSFIELSGTGTNDIQACF